MTNAVYFNAAWRTPFAKDATRPGKFHRGKAGDVTVPMMHGEPRFRFADPCRERRCVDLRLEVDAREAERPTLALERVQFGVGVIW